MNQDSKENLENSLKSITEDNGKGNDPILSKSDVLPFVLKGNEISLSEAPTDSVLPILPIFITSSIVSQPLISLNIESSDTVTIETNSQTDLSDNGEYDDEPNTNLCSTGLLIKASEDDIVSDLAVCAASTVGKECCTCYTCILSEDACYDIVGSAVELRDTLTFDNQCKQAHNLQETQLHQNGMRKDITYSAKGCCSNNSLENEDDDIVFLSNSTKFENVGQQIPSNLNNAFLLNDKFQNETSQMKQFNKIQKSKDEPRYDVIDSNNETDVYKCINKSPGNVAFPDKSLEIVQCPSIATLTTCIETDKAEIPTNDSSYSEYNMNEKICNYSGYFKVILVPVF